MSFCPVNELLDWMLDQVRHCYDTILYSADAVEIRISPSSSSRRHLLDIRRAATINHMLPIAISTTSMSILAIHLCPACCCSLDLVCPWDACLVEACNEREARQAWPENALAALMLTLYACCVYIHIPPFLPRMDPASLSLRARPQAPL